jgi:hypothetical protein
VKPLAIIVKFFNEPAHLPLWLGHYGRQVGLEHCYLLDHGSDDGSQTQLGRAHVIRLPRSAQDDYKHLHLIQTFGASLLERYRYVLHVDMDEFVVADPASYASLTDYAERCTKDLVSMIGLEVQQVTGHDRDVQPDMPILAQRPHVWFNSALCKPALTSGLLDWSPGFHCMKAETVFDDLYLFHLRYFDRAIGLRRLDRSRNQPWSHPDQAGHQRMSDAAWIEMLEGFGDPARLSNHTAERGSVALDEHLAKVIASRAGREDNDYRIDLNIHSPQLWRIPERLARIF